MIELLTSCARQDHLRAGGRWARELVIAGATLSIAASAWAADTSRQLTLDSATVALGAARAAAAEQHHSVAMAVVDAGGFPIVVERADGVPAGMGEAAVAKARTAALYGLPTKLMGNLVSQGSTGLLALPQALPVDGGVPLMVGGRVVGAIGVAGSDSASDGVAAERGAAQFAGR